MCCTSIVLVGAGGHARSVSAVMTEKPTRTVIAGEDESYLASYRGENVIVTVGYVGNVLPLASTRRRIIDLYERHEVSFGTVVADSAFIADDAQIGAGSVVLCRAVINSGAKIGRHAIVNTGAIIEHDVVLGVNVTVSPGAIVLGGSVISDDVFIGAGAVIRQCVKIASGVVIGMGSIVTVDIVEPGIYVGNPVRRIK